MKGAMKGVLKGARKALTEMPMPAMPKDMPEMAQRPKPSLSLELADIEGGEDLQMGETVTLTVTGKVTSMDAPEEGDDKELHTHVRLRLSKIARTGAPQETEPTDDE